MLEEKLKSSQTAGREIFKSVMLAPNWEDLHAEKCRLINYVAGRQHTEIILRKIEEKIVQSCFYCINCENCIKLSDYKNVFQQQGFWIFNKYIKYWDVYDPNWSIRNRIFKLLAVRNPVDT